MSLTQKELQQIAKFLGHGTFTLNGDEVLELAYINQRLAEEYQQQEAAGEVKVAEEENNAAVGNNGGGGEEPQSD